MTGLTGNTFPPVETDSDMVRRRTSLAAVAPLRRRRRTSIARAVVTDKSAQQQLCPAAT